MASSESKTLIVLALIANSIIAVIKFVAASISGSSAMLAEAFHSVADTGNQLFLLRGAVVSRYAASSKHPFGRGKEMYFWSFMVAVVLFVGGAVVAILEGIEKVRHPHPSEGLVFSLVVLGLAAFFEIVIAFRPAIKQFNKVRSGRSIASMIRESRDPALIVVVFEDAAAVVGLTVAAAGLILADVTGQGAWDGIASIVIGVLLAGTAWILAYEMKALLVGESAPRHARSLIRSATLSVPGVESIGRVLTMQLASHQILVNMDVDLEDGLSAADAEAVIDRIEANIREQVPDATRIFIEIESKK